MKLEEKPTRLEDVELVPNAMERLEGAMKHVARKPGGKPGVALAKPKPQCRITRRLYPLWKFRYRGLGLILGRA